MNFFSTLTSPLAKVWQLVFPKPCKEVADLILALDLFPDLFEITPDAHDRENVIIKLTASVNGVEIYLSTSDIWLRRQHYTMQLTAWEKVALNDAVDEWLYK